MKAIDQSDFDIMFYSKAIKMGGGEIKIDDSWPTYPNPQYWGVGQPFKDAGELTGHRAYVYTDDGQPALVSEE